MKTTPPALPPGAAADPPALADMAARQARPGRADALPPGTVIDGCEIVRVVADSGFAIVYLAREPGTKRRFAIKEYLPISLALRSANGRSVALRAPEHAEAFERGLLAFSAEARLLELRTHPALLRVLRSGRGQGTAYRVMPWLEGDTLLSLRRSLPEPPEEAALRRLLFGLLGALQTLHDAGEVHGAVSPGNIMVLADDRAMLLDTNAVARALVGDQTRALMAMVSPGFAPQGPAAAEPGGTGDTRPAAGVAADLHALAAVAHFCISGTLPAAGARHAPLAGVVRGLRLRLSRPAYSASLLAAIDAALSADLAQRPTSVAEFRAALSGQAEPVRAAAAPAAGRAAATAGDGPAWEPGVNATDGATTSAATSAPKHSPAPAHARGYRTRYPGTRPRHAQRLAWWGGGALLALTLATVGLVVVQERAAIALRAEGFTAPASPDLAPPAALPARAATGRVAAPLEPAASATLAVAPPVVLPPEKPARAVAAAARPGTARAPAAKATSATSATPAAPSKPLKPPPAEKPQSPAARGAERAATTSPRAECGARTEFALYRCMKTECQLPRWSKHAECQRLRETDSVD